MKRNQTKWLLLIQTKAVRLSQNSRLEETTLNLEMPLKVNQSKELLTTKIQTQNNNQKSDVPTITKKKWKEERDVKLKNNTARTKENKNKKTFKLLKKRLKKTS
jgi:hypothetical protein